MLFVGFEKYIMLVPNKYDVDIAKSIVHITLKAPERI